jgi:glyoxylase-like metal-dependent hydrolase (beta-lactamase superfamily II)
MKIGAYDVDILIQGFPGKTLKHGGLGWSTVLLLRGQGRIAVLDTGSFNMRQLLVDALEAHGVSPQDVTDLILSHLHYDHVVNWPMFPNARPIAGAREMAWALGQPAGHPLLPELYIAELSRHPALKLVGDGEEILPGVTAYLAPGHTPGHLVFLVNGGEKDALLVQDAAKYRSELLTRTADMTHDPALTRVSIDKIWTLWQRKPATVLIPGHDLPMVLENGTPKFIGRHEAGIAAIFGDEVSSRTVYAFGPT